MTRIIESATSKVFYELEYPEDVNVVDSPQWFSAQSTKGCTLLIVINGNTAWPLCRRKIRGVNIIEAFGADTRSRVAPIVCSHSDHPTLALIDLPSDVDLLDLRRVPIALSCQICPEANVRIIRSDGICYSLRLPGSWEAFEKSLHKKFRSNLRNRMGRLTKDYPGAFLFQEILPSLTSLSNCFEISNDVSSNSWQGNKKISVFSNKDKQRLILEALRNGIQVRFFYCTIEGKPCAMRWSFDHMKSTLFYISEFDANFRDYSIGNLLNQFAIQQYINHGYTRIDFGYGISEHKTAWGAIPTNLCRIMIPLTTMGHLLIRYQKMRWAVGSLLRQFNKDHH